MEDLTEDNLEQIITENSKVFVMYGATWCGSCKMIKPKVKKTARDNQSILFVYVDAEHMEKSRDFSGKLSSLPTFASFENGQLLGRDTGTKSIDSILELLK